jgi:hypothetical protein
MLKRVWHGGGYSMEAIRAVMMKAIIDYKP